MKQNKLHLLLIWNSIPNKEKGYNNNRIYFSIWKRSIENSNIIGKGDMGNEEKGISGFISGITSYNGNRLQ